MIGARRHWAIASLWAFAPSLFAQQGVTGKILGTVTDASGLAVASASIVARNMATSIEYRAHTNDRGLFLVFDLAPGIYDLIITATGFENEVYTGLTLAVGADVEVSPRLRVGNLQETLIVNGRGNGFDLASSSPGGSIDEHSIADLPLNGRDWTQLATLQPGVAAVDSQQTNSTLRVQRGNGVDLTISGGRPVENNYTLNGISINDYANAAPGSSLGINLGVDAIQEFAVISGPIPAEYGRLSGGVIVAVTRSGGTALHGSLYYFHRNSALDARNFFDTSSQSPSFRRHQFGGSAGGPLRRRKTFWFANYEQLRESLGQPLRSLVPSVQAREGMFLSNGAFSKINVSPAILPYLGIYPTPNQGLTSDPNVGIFAFAGEKVSHEEFVTGRLDQHFSERDTLQGEMLYDDGSVVQPDEFNNKPSTLPSERYTGSLGETHLFSDSVINSLRAGFSRTSAKDGYYASAYNSLLTNTSLGFIPGHNVGAIQVAGLTTFSGGVGRASGNIFNYTSYQLNDSLLLNKGVHSLKLGFSAEVIRDDSDSADSADGTLTFNSLSDFLRDKPYSFAALLPGSNTIRGIHQAIAAGYFQDDMRLGRSLTIEIGVRYEMVTQPAEAHGLLASLKNLTDATSTIGPYFNHNPTLRNFEPRLGLAWDPFGMGKLSIRAGFGIFDDLPLPYIFVNEAARATPFYEGGQTSTIPQGTSPSSVYSLLSPSKRRTVYVQPNPDRSYKMDWTFNVERELRDQLMFAVGYTGSGGVHLPWRVNNMDTVSPTITPQGFVYPDEGETLNPRFGRIAGLLFNGNSNYNALQVSLRKRPSHGLQGQVSYTFSKSIDNASGSFSSNEYSNTIGIPVPFDTQINRGPSDFDQRNHVTVSVLWDLPIAVNKSGFFPWLTKGWELGSIFTASSGEPFSVGIAGDPAGSKLGSDAAQRPIPIVSPVCSSQTNPGDAADYIKEQCFAFPQPGVIGAIVGRNTLNAPGLADLDFSLFKNNRLRSVGENINVQFRVEAFNLLNHTNFAPPVSSNFQSPVIFDSTGHLIPSASILTSTETPARQIQVGLKVIW